MRIEERALKYFENFFYTLRRGGTVYSGGCIADQQKALINIQKETAKELITECLAIIYKESKGWTDKQKEIANYLYQKIFTNMNFYCFQHSYSWPPEKESNEEKKE